MVEYPPGFPMFVIILEFIIIVFALIYALYLSRSRTQPDGDHDEARGKLRHVTFAEDDSPPHQPPSTVSKNKKEGENGKRK